MQCALTHTALPKGPHLSITACHLDLFMFDIHPSFVKAHPKSIMHFICRSLRLRDSDSVFLDLVPDSLQSFSFELMEEVFDPAIPGRMTGLTQLQISTSSLDRNCSMQRLKLEDLAIIQCPEAISAILRSGAFRELRKLHIDSYYSTQKLISGKYCELGYYEDESELKESEATELGGIIQSLPHLEQLSGRSRLFEQSMVDFLKDWHKGFLTRHEMANLISVSDPRMPVWRKP